MTRYLPFDPNPRTPTPLPPVGTCDCQFHVFGPPERYPVRPGAVYEMPSADIAAALHMHRTLGIQRGVIVQATTYGADHRVVLDGLAAAGPGYRGCANAAVLLDADESELEDLDRAGVKGARFNRPGLGITLSRAEFDRAVGRLRDLGWYMKIQPEASGIMDLAWMIEDQDIPVIIDHMGRPDPSLGADDPSLRKVLDLLERGNFWVMLSLGEKISRSGPPHDDVAAVARRLIDAAPDRMIWGSDWPHPVSVKQPPNDADMLELLYRYAPEETVRHKILVENPARFFGF